MAYILFGMFCKNFRQSFSKVTDKVLYELLRKFPKYNELLSFSAVANNRDNLGSEIKMILIMKGQSQVSAVTEIGKANQNL